MSLYTSHTNLSDIDRLLRIVKECPGLFTYDPSNTIMERAVGLGVLHIGANDKLWPGASPRRSAIINPALVQPNKAEADGEIEWVV